MVTNFDSQDFKELSKYIANLRKNLELATEPMRQIREAVEKGLVPYQKQTNDIQKALKSFGQQLTTTLKPIRQLNLRNEKFFKEIHKALQEWPQNQREATIKLANHGWYIDPGMPITASTKLARALDDANGETVSEELSKYFREKTDEIEKRLILRYPHRNHIIHDAFDAHRNGLFNLSIPVILTQADGIWWDAYSSSLFQKGKRTSKVKERFREDRNLIFSAFFGVLEENVPLWMSEPDRNREFSKLRPSQLNRHLVLHGETIEYGTEENSLKAISFLGWLCWMLNWNDKQDA